MARRNMNMKMKNVRNPRNPDSWLYKTLTRLFSGPVTGFRTQSYRQLKRWQLDKYRFQSASGKSFKKSSYSPFDNIYANTQVNQARAERYIDFDQMEYDSIIHSALDIYADEMTYTSPLQKVVNVHCPNEEIKDVINNLLFGVMNVEFNLYGWCRSLCQKGDFFLYLDVDDKVGVKNFIGIPQQEIERLEGEDKTNPNYVQFQWNSGGLTFENWQVAHFRILGNDKHAPYGTSVLDPVRRIWRQLQLQEDAMMAYRIVRSPSRRVFYIDVGGIPEKDVEQHMENIVTQMKRNQVIDGETGRVDLRYNPMSVDEDYFIPVRGTQQTTKIDTLEGAQYIGDIDDVKYLRDRLLAGLKIPHSYLLMTEGGEEDKTTLAQKDIRFARTIQRLQRSVVSELEKIAMIHLYILGYRGKDLTSFKLSLNNPSKISELQELEHWRTKFEVAAAATEGYFSKQWVAKNIMGLSEDEFLRNIREMAFDRKLDASLEALLEPAEMGGDLGGGLGGDLGGEEDLLGGEEGLEPEEEAGTEEEETLLASPGKRYDRESTTTAKSKGKRYKPVKDDKRRGFGPRLRQYSGSWNKERSRNTARNVVPGLEGLSSISRGLFEGYQEYHDAIYNEMQHEQEKSLFEDNEEINALMEGLKKRAKEEENGETET